MAILLPNGKQHYTTDAGLPLVGGKLFTYAAGTLTPKATFKDSNSLAANTNPVILDARGDAVVFWDGAYKVELRDSLDNVIWTVDGIIGVDVNAEIDAAIAALKAQLADAANVSLGDAMIGVKQPFTGSSAQTQHNINAQWVHIANFGAVGDGVTDDTAAFQRAVNWLRLNTTKNMEVRLAAQPYRIAGTISVTGAVRFVGEGYQSFEQGKPSTRPAKGTWLIHDNAAGPMFSYSGNTGHGAGLRDIAIFQTGHPAPGPGWAPAERDWVIRNENTIGSLFLTRVHFHNVYRGVNTIQAHRPQYEDITGQFFFRAFAFDAIYDLGKMDGLAMWTFWSEQTDVLQWTQANSIGLTLLRVDGLWVDRIFGITQLQTVYCGASAVATGGPGVINIGGLYSDFSGRALVVDVTAAFVTVNSLFHLGQKWPPAPVASLPGSCGVHIASGTNSLVQISNFRSTLAETSAVKINGSANQVWIDSAIVDQYDFLNSGAGAYSVDAANQLYLGNASVPQTFLGAVGPIQSGAGSVRGQLQMQFIPGATPNKPVTQVAAAGQLVPYTAEGEANAGVALVARNTGVVQVGATTNALGFYGGAAVPKQAGVPVTAGGVHAALVALGLIAP